MISTDWDNMGEEVQGGVVGNIAQAYAMRDLPMPPQQELEAVITRLLAKANGFSTEPMTKAQKFRFLELVWEWCLAKARGQELP